MQDVAQVKEPGESISKPGFAPEVYRPLPYIPPATMRSNPPGANISGCQRFKGQVCAAWARRSGGRANKAPAARDG